MKRNKSQQGFTLLEILVAATILFSSIVAIALVYRGALLSSEKAANKVNQVAVVPLVIKSVQAEIRAARPPSLGEVIEGSGQQLGVYFSYQAEVVDIKNPPDRFDNTSGNMKPYPNKFVLYKVSLEVGDKAPQVFIYKELAWL